MKTQAKKIDIHRAKGELAQKQVESLLRRGGMAGAVKFAGSIAFEVARDSRLEYSRRVKRAKAHARTKDIFEC